MKIIFIVDDSDTSRVAAKSALENHFKTFALPSALKMFKLLERIKPDLILLDVDMPEMDGFAAMKYLNENQKTKDIPVIFLTAKQDPDSEIRGFELGAIDFVSKPFSPPVLLKRIESQISLDTIIKESQKALMEVHDATINVLSNLVESRDETTGGHVERTQTYLDILTRELINRDVYSDEISTWDLDLFLSSSQLHDIGKISVSDNTLNKPGRLTEEEFNEIKKHCLDGEEIIAQIIYKSNGHALLYHARLLSGSHHEKWDGTGYPRGLSGISIPLQGRLMAVVDVYDALVSVRPYKKAFSHEEALKIIIEGRGTHFDPEIVDAFESASEDICAANEAFAASQKVNLFSMLR